MLPTTPTSSEMGAIRGQVRDDDGQPIAEAVVLIADGPSHADIAALTGVEGEYNYINLAPGKYTLLVNAIDREPQRQVVDVLAGQTAQLDFDLSL